MSAVTQDLVTGVVISAISYVLEIPESAVDPSAELAALGADSLAIVQIADVVEQSLSQRQVPIVIADADLSSIKTVGAVIDYLVARS